MSLQYVSNCRFSSFHPALCYDKYSGRGEELNNIAIRLQEGGHIDKLNFEELRKIPVAKVSDTVTQ